jgi:murein DD-endopeptidase MepM/ murein hydrolase activator NlpD
VTTWPIPGKPITSRYGIKGSHWRACGWHTGADIAAPTGTPILAPEAGRIVHVNYGSSFGGKQLALRPASGGEWFFAHCSWRAAPGPVAEGAHIANVGNEGNSTGPHLHLEWHTAPGWACSLMRDPAARLSTPTPAPPPPPEKDDDMIVFFQVRDGDGNLGPTNEAQLLAGTWYQLTDADTFSARQKVLKDNGVAFKLAGAVDDPRCYGRQVPGPGAQSF